MEGLFKLPWDVNNFSLLLFRLELRILILPMINIIYLAKCCGTVQKICKNISLSYTQFVSIYLSSEFMRDVFQLIVIIGVI